MEYFFESIDFSIKSSSQKVNHPCKNIFSPNLNNFWESDSGTPPHHLLLNLGRKNFVSKIRIYFDTLKDESYTPSLIEVYIGYNSANLAKARLVELNEPQGWVDIAMSTTEEYVETLIIKLAFIHNHENGKDLRIRALKLVMPKTYVKNIFGLSYVEPNTKSFKRYSNIR